MSREVTIYKIQNLKNNKVYIGQTTQDLERRLQMHISDLKNKKTNRKSKQFIKDFEKYGINSFRIKPITKCNKENRFELEKMCIISYDAYNPDKGYNRPDLGNKLTKTLEHKVKIALSLKNNKLPFGVTKDKDKSCKSGFRYRYRYKDDNGKSYNISSTNLDKLEAKVKAKELPWFTYQEMIEYVKNNR